MYHVRARYLKSAETSVGVEQLHLISRQWAEYFLNGKQLINFTLTSKQRLTIAQLTQDTADRPDIHRPAIRCTDTQTTLNPHLKLEGWR